MSKLNLSVAIGDYDRNRPLINGAVQIDGVDPVFMTLPPEEIFFRAFRQEAFDICECSLSSFTVKTALGTSPYVGVPAFVSRMFRHTSIYCRTDRIKKPADLKGKKVAHTTASSNSGNLAPRVLLPKQGLTPEKDYKVIFSGKHDQSVLGVNSGDYDGAPVASDVFERMCRRGTVKCEDFRIIYKSPKFPTSSFGYAHDLHPDLVKKIKKAFNDFRFTEEMKKQFGGADRFSPITYKNDWAVVREIAEATGESYTREQYEKAAAKEAEKLKKKKQKK